MAKDIIQLNGDWFYAPKTERDWEVILLVGLSLFGLGTLLALGMLELPVIDVINPFK